MGEEVSNGQIYKAILGLTDAVGGVKADVKSNHEYTANVSGKCDIIRKELQDHASKDEKHYADENAHPGALAARSEKSKAGWATWLMVGLAAAELIFHGREYLKGNDGAERRGAIHGESRSN